MSLLSGINHAALVTGDLPRLVAFYTEVFEAEILFEEDGPELRHAMLRVGDGVLHPVERRGSPHGAGSPSMLQRGHLDHLGLTVASREAFDLIRSRLLARGATDGAVTSIGPQMSFWFADPDGMRAEVCCITAPELRGFHGPEPVPQRSP
jgi:catechol 2,3-dioxygenase-like lactoylglutathione lyase family enzyme